MIVLALCACQKGSERSPGPAASVGASPTATLPVEPPGILAELHLVSAERFWQQIRGSVGGPLGVHAASASAALALLLDLPAAHAPLLRDDAALVGLIVETGHGPEAIIGWGLRSGPELVAALTTGSHPTHAVVRDPDLGLEILTRIPRQSDAWSLAVLDHHLLVAADPALLTRLGSYVVRTLATRTPPNRSASLLVRGQALAGPVAQLVANRWAQARDHLEKIDRANRAAHGGRAPDFGDPAVALRAIDGAVEQLLELLRSTERLELGLDLTQDRANIRVELVPRKGGRLAGLASRLPLGDPAALLDLPRESAFAIVTYSSPEGRLAVAKRASQGLVSLLGDRLASPDRTRVEEALVAVAKARGDRARGAVARTALGPVLFLESTLVDPAALDRGATGLVGLLRAPAFAEPLGQVLGEARLRFDEQNIAGLGARVRSARVRVRPPHGTSGSVLRPDQGTSIEALWFAKDGRSVAAVGPAARSATLDWLGASEEPARSLKGEASVAEAVRRIGDQVSCAIVLQPAQLRLDRSAGPSAPVLLALGRQDAGLWLRMEGHLQVLASLLRGSMR